MESIIVALAAGGFALLFALFTATRVIRADAGNQRMRAIGDAIREGAGTFLRREYLILAPFVIIVAAGLLVLIDWWTEDRTVPETAIAYLAGTICSAPAGFIGMNVAHRANVRTAAAARQRDHHQKPANRTNKNSQLVQVCAMDKPLQEPVARSIQRRKTTVMRPQGDDSH